MARAWTGHNLADDASPATYEFFSNRHDKHDKTLFGITQKWDAQDTIDELVNGVRRDQTAWFLASKLWSEFGDPGWVTADLLNHLADVMKTTNMSAFHTVKALFLRDEFWAPERRMCMIKPPIPWLIELQRRSGQRLSDRRSRIPTRHDGPSALPAAVGAGWGHNTAWLSGTQTLGRARAANDLANDAQSAGFFDGLGDMAPEAAVNRILDAFGVPDASQALVTCWRTGTSRSASPTTSAIETSNAKHFESERCSRRSTSHDTHDTRPLPPTLHRWHRCRRSRRIDPAVGARRHGRCLPA